ncbi:peptide-methionine (S)-S-oxide reductase MsrA [Phenylobacterium sp.]|jgi:peptide-methionine (S)-S-oxide reductase|uniref:peptide-methionine (S)-S-oxide reductase MsrA n=1 Tax=Phenylobacterium sp. TaxID=1871053 RepID=UPI002F3F788C
MPLLPRAHRFGKALRATLLAGVALAGVFAARGLLAPGVAEAAPMAVPLAAYDKPPSGPTETAVLSGGCFWGMQGVFEHVKGVKQVISGYAGGQAATAQYDLVSTGTTGHAESIKIVFDPAQVSYGQILRIFFSVATDPTQVGGQFPDEGSQYRSEIWYATPAQKDVADRYVAQLDAAHAFAKPIATRVDPLRGFFAAEGYHQDYLVHHPDSGYIATYDLPKVAALKRIFPASYVATPVLTVASR